jgi:hypothetical protein
LADLPEEILEGGEGGQIVEGRGLVGHCSTDQAVPEVMGRVATPLLELGRGEGTMKRARGSGQRENWFSLETNSASQKISAIFGFSIIFR